MIAVLALMAGAAACAADAPVDDDAALVRRIDAALATSGKWLVRQQVDDGAWYSQTYGALRTGPTLTPYVLSTLLFLPQAGDDGVAAYRRGVQYLGGFVDDQGRLKVEPRELGYPVYTAAMAARMVVHVDRTEANLAAQKAWIDYVRERQLTEPLGWQPDDPEYGGWGFAMDLPHKPPPGEPKELFHESNLSATLFAIAAIRSYNHARASPAAPPGTAPQGHPHVSAPRPGKSAAKTPIDPALRKALIFVQRCQNYHEPRAGGDEADARFDDGGFFFMPEDAAQNKAGLAGTDGQGRTRFRSYGTMTVDGLRALLRCGLAEDHPRVVAARRWLERNYSATANPGQFPEERAVLQNATYYYWTWAVAHALLALNAKEIETPRGRMAWAPSLAEELLRRQRADGTWANRYTDAKEDDPLVATPWAAAALAICRQALEADGAD